ncbi:MAG: hypothetical protein KJO81_12020 [Gammaproteobacteria bacterium]|nr:hypothetical protein [Gammaproteobacteria bacterium]NNC67098.1 hypothetical protein [Gammaproteobacteria bacterium]
MAYNFEKSMGLRKTLLLSGIATLTLSLLLFFGCLIGLFEFESFSLFGYSGLRSLAAIAILGCLFAAIGSWDD